MNTKQLSTLADVFAIPTKTTLRWTAVRSLFEALGADVTEGRGSRVRVALNGVRATFHSPHPSPEIGRKTVADIRDFLIAAGIRHDSREE